MELKHLKCKRCDYEWIPRTDKEPKECPNCKRRKWNTPIAILAIASMLATGCQKDEHTNNGMGWDGKNHITGNCAYNPIQHDGVIASSYTVVNIQADVVNHPLDSIQTSICKQNNTECKSTPSVYIIYAPNRVILRMAQDAGYTDYHVIEAICNSVER